MDDNDESVPSSRFDLEAATRDYEESLRHALRGELERAMPDTATREAVIERLLVPIHRFAGAYAAAVERQRLAEKRARRGTG